MGQNSSCQVKSLARQNKRIKMFINNAVMFALYKVLIERRDPFSENLCVSDSTSDESNIYKQKMKVSYSSTVSARPTCIVITSHLTKTLEPIIPQSFKMMTYCNCSVFLYMDGLGAFLKPEAYHLEASNSSLYVGNNAGVFHPTNQSHGIFFCPNMESAD